MSEPPTPPPPPNNAAPYPLSRLSPPFSLVDAAQEIEAADTMVAAVASAELEAIARQIRALREQAEQVLARAQRDAELHRADVRFRKQPGKLYHLYEEPSGRRYFSMLSPEDWRGAPPHPVLGSYRLGVDLRWTLISGGEESSDARIAQVRQALGSGSG